MAESIRIDLRGEQVLNSKTVYSRNRLPRLGIEKTEWEREAEEKYKIAAMSRERDEEREKQRKDLGEGQAVEDEGMMTELWRRSQVGCSDRVDIQESSRPSKRRRGIIITNWGQEVPNDEQERVGEWLFTKDSQQQQLVGTRQTTIRVWSWLELEARQLLIELAESVQRVCKEQEAELINMLEEEREQDTLKEPTDDQQTEITQELIEVEQEPRSKKVQEQETIVSLWKKKEERLSEEQARRGRVQIGESKRAELLARLRPEKWLEQEARRVLIEIMERAAEKATERERADKEAKRKDLEKKRAEKLFEKNSKKVKKKPWGWIKIEARQILVEIVGEIERVGRVKIGERKKRELLEKLNKRRAREGKPTPPPAQPPEVAIEDGRTTKQILTLNLVRGNREGSGKRKRNHRGGAWLSWEGMGGLRPDPVRGGRRLKNGTVEKMDEGKELLQVQVDDEQPGGLAGDLRTLTLDDHGDGDKKYMAEQELVGKLLGLRLEATIPTPTESTDINIPNISTMPAWELQEILWLTGVVLDSKKSDLAR